MNLDATGTATLVVSSLAAGAHNLSANYPGDAVLQASSGGPITEVIADYTIQAQPASLTILSGQTGSATLDIIPLGGSMQTVKLSCGGLPLNVSCTFSPASVTLDGVNAGVVKVTINTRLTMASANAKSGLRGTASTLAFAAILLPFGRRKRLKMLLGMAGIFVIALYGAGCGSSGGNPNYTPTGVYVLNVSASRGTGSAAKTIPLVVTITK